MNRWMNGEVWMKKKCSSLRIVTKRKGKLFLAKVPSISKTEYVGFGVTKARAIADAKDYIKRLKRCK